MNKWDIRRQTHSCHAYCFRPCSGGEKGISLGLAASIASCYSVRMISGAMRYKHLITPEDVCVLLPWAFATVQISPLPSFPLFRVSCRLWIPGWSQHSHFCKLERSWGCSLNPFQQAHGVLLCWEETTQRIISSWGLPSIALVSLSISISNSDVRKLTLSELVVKCFFWCVLFL